MKKTVITFIILILSGIGLYAQTEKEIKAEIKHVTVFPDRSQIDHEATVSLLPGKTVLKLTTLSPYIDAQSIQVKGVGEFTILSVNHQNNYLQNLEDTPEMKKLRSRMEDLKLKAEDEKAAIAVLKEKEAFLIANRAILVKETNFTIEQMKSVMDLYTNSMDQVTMTVLKKTRIIKDYEKQITALQQQISDRLGKQQLPSGEIFVTVSSEKQVSGKLSFSYVSGKSGWYPSYDIRVDDIRKPVTILYKANVFQNSGVEWENVKLSFSNATPWVAGDIPVLNPWFVDYYYPVAVLQRKKSISNIRSEAPEIMAMTLEDKTEVREMAAAPVMVEKKVGETTITFDIGVPYTIPSDGRVQTVEIQRLSAPAEYKYVTLPKISPMAYLTANITNWEEFSLQSGEATLYFENSFVGKSTISADQLKDTLALSLGTDNSIVVKREKRKDFTSKRIIGSNKTETFSYLITIRNNKKTPVRVTLNDQIPISSNSGITVEAIDLSGGKHNQQTGEIRWDLEINQQESRELILSYSVKYPKDKTVILE
jgi:uncharacterized protein (TIGR02231 family)